jgi:dipeptidyl aminopeptidase/acylaminoacyl peptidase
MYSLGEGYARAELMDITSGRRRIVAQAPVARAEFLVDHAGEVRFATGQNVENDTLTYYRQDGKSDWQLINDQAVTGVWVEPIGFSKDNAAAYVWSSRKDGPDAIERLDLATMERTEVLRHSRVDPHRIIFDPATDEPIGATFMDGVPESQFFDAASPQARTVRSLEAAVPGQSVQLRSATADGNQQLVIVSSDRNPGDFYHLDRTQRSANLWASRADWVMPDQMAEAKPIELKARDGLALHGYLTTPLGREAKGLPMVVLPHGGPHGVRDGWGFDIERQLLAARGYAVLQVNFRGSGGYGGAFEHAGYQQWGAAMQDDVTDATRWAIEQGVADPKRVCLYGSSFGGYSALMGVAREPALYACAAGNVGVYDLDMMYGRGDLQARRWGENYLKLVVGEEGLDARSPAKLAASIKVPVLLAAGELDERTPPEQTKAMERALQAAGVPVEAHYYDNEGHGYYLLSNRRDYYTKLLTFLDRHLGAAR